MLNMYINVGLLQNLSNYKILNVIRLKLSGGVVHLKPNIGARGNVLLSYTTLPFVTRERVLEGHTNRWECREMARLFLKRGYAVDVIDWENNSFVPRKEYAYFIDIHKNIERLAPFLNKDCIKILHITTSEPEFQNNAEKNRLSELEKRRGVKLSPRRQVTKTNSMKYADYVSILGNAFTESTYNLKNKSLFHIPISTTHTYPSPERKDFNSAKRNFIWFGGVGAVHKGLDLVLEAFAEMPLYNLTVMGKASNEKDFAKEYTKELYDTININYVGFIDPGSSEFKNMINNSIGIVYPSSSEGQSGAVITAMHAGLIPIISENSGINVLDFGILLKKNTVEEIREVVKKIASATEDELKKKALGAWTYAREYHTRERFSKEYDAFIESLIKKNEK